MCCLDRMEYVMIQMMDPLGSNDMKQIDRKQNQDVVGSKQLNSLEVFLALQLTTIHSLKLTDWKAFLLWYVLFSHGGSFSKILVSVIIQDLGHYLVENGFGRAVTYLREQCMWALMYASAGQDYSELGMFQRLETLQFIEINFEAVVCFQIMKSAVTPYSSLKIQQTYQWDMSCPCSESNNK